jgi:uncharacterized cupredoxin-like copper-binding protein
MRNPGLLNGCLLLLLLLLSACAGQPTVYTVPQNGAERVVSLQADSFSFAPSIIRAHQGDRLLLRVSNMAGIRHNLTVRNPRGELIRDVHLPAGETVEVPLLLTDEGTWEFVCNKPLHETLGMAGRIEAATLLQ